MKQVNLTSPVQWLGLALSMSFFLSSCSCICPEIRYGQNTRCYTQKEEADTIKYGVAKYDGATAQYQYETGPETKKYGTRPNGKKYTIGQYEGVTDRYIYRQGNSDISPKKLELAQNSASFPADMTPEEQRDSLPLEIEVDDVLFDFDKAVIKAPFIPELNKWVTYFKNNPLVSAEIYGHTDSTGPSEYNQKLSERRAAAVIDYIVEHGVSRNRLNAKGYGETVPAASNATTEGRKKNRRVELEL